MNRFGEMLIQSEEAQRVVDQRTPALDARRLKMAVRFLQTNFEEQREVCGEDWKYKERESEARRRVELENS